MKDQDRSRLVANRHWANATLTREEIRLWSTTYFIFWTRRRRGTTHTVILIAHWTAAWFTQTWNVIWFFILNSLVCIINWALAQNTCWMLPDSYWFTPATFIYWCLLQTLLLRFRLNVRRIDWNRSFLFSLSPNLQWPLYQMIYLLCNWFNLLDARNFNHFLIFSLIETLVSILWLQSILNHHFYESASISF